MDLEGEVIFSHSRCKSHGVRITQSVQDAHEEKEEFIL